MKIREILIEGQHAPEYAVIYIIRHNDEVLYVGKSWNVESRLSEHFDPESQISSVHFSTYAKKMAPASWDWNVEFVELPHDISNINKANYWIRNKEAMLIRELSPKYNIQYNE